MSTRDQREYLEVLGFALPLPSVSGGLAPRAPAPQPIAAPVPAARAPRPNPAPAAAAPRNSRSSTSHPAPTAPSEWRLVSHGPSGARLAFVCEAPAHAASAEGELLAKMTIAMGLNPAEVLVVEIAGGDPESPVLTYLENLLVPALAGVSQIVAFGNLPARAALRKQDPMSNLRGKSHTSPLLASGTRVWATYAPSLCIRNPNMKKPVWEDLQQLMKELT